MNLELNKNILRIDNYKQINQIKNDLISLKDIDVYGTNLGVLFLDKYQIVIKGNFIKIILEKNYELQNKNE